MGDKKKKLCKWKNIKDNLDEYISLVSPAEYVCKKCGRTANNKESLCKPVKINK